MFCSRVAQRFRLLPVFGFRCHFGRGVRRLDGEVCDRESIEPVGYRATSQAQHLSSSKRNRDVSGAIGKYGLCRLECSSYLPGSSLDRGVRSYGQDPQRQVPAAAQEIVLRRERVIGLCRAPDFSIEKLRQAIQQSDGNP
jgi:hypothetical protein